MLSARKRTKTPVAPTCRPKSPYSLFFGEPGLFFRIFWEPGLRVIIDLFCIVLLLGPYSTTPHWPKQVYIIEKTLSSNYITWKKDITTPHWPKQVYIIEKTLSSNYITWKKEIHSEHWRVVMPSFAPPVVRDNKQFERTIYTTFKHWLVTTTGINNKTW